MSIHLNIDRATVQNSFYRRVLYTNRKMQLVVMSLRPGEEIGREKHPHTSQFIRVERGRGLAIIGRKKYRLKPDSAVIIPPGKWHNIINTGRRPLQLYTIYTPPEHPANRRQRFKK